jgi:tetratricopeptide (TPR) repeat protein
MSFAEQLRVLQAAQGDAAKLALATVDLKYPEVSESERAALREALEAAAIPHWCNKGILAALLQISPEDSAARLKRLRGLTVVEPFLARGETAVNVHESARLALRKAMVSDSRGRFCTLSRRAAARFENDITPAGRTEWIYHLLGADAERGADELETLSGQWWGRARPEDEYALAAALKELEDSRLTAGRARVWSLLAIIWARRMHGDAAQLEAEANDVLCLAREIKDQSAEGDAQALLGDTFQAQGKLAEAQAAFGEDLAISRRLAGQDPGNAGWQRKLAVAHRRVGDLLDAQGKLAEAQAAFGEDLTISRRLASQDPGNAGWQRDLAAAHNRMGGVLEARGKLADAQAAFGESLAISRRLAAQDPSNARWQQDLAVAHTKVGGVLEVQGKLAEAQAAFGESLAISRRLVAQDPSNARWQQELAMAHSKVGGALQAQGKLAEAQAAFGESVAILRRLAAQEPSNAGWQRDLAGACVSMARFEVKSDRHAAALPFYEEASRIFGELAVKAPGFAQWAKDKELVEAELAACRLMVKSA